MKTIAVIMAGGSGVRFWPYSRKKHPKQLLALTSDRPMLIEAIDRLKGVISSKDTWVVAGHELEHPIKKVLGKKGRFVCEPAGKNTAACIGLAAVMALKEERDAVLAVFPADHHISNPVVFRNEIKRAIKYAKTHDEIVTLGIRPTFPATGYGYIKMGEDIGGGLHSVEAFVEKPALSKAQSYLKTKRYLWNAGIFVARASILAAGIAEHMPDLARVLGRWLKNKKAGESAYKKLASISIDYGVMEKASNVVVLPSKAVWSDVGSWPALQPYMKSDSQGNRFYGEFVNVDSSGCLVQSDEGIVATVGVRDLIIVRHGDGILICAKDQDQRIREIVDRLPGAYR